LAFRGSHAGGFDAWCESTYMERQHDLERAGKPLENLRVEPATAHQSWENPLLRLGVEQMTSTDHYCPPQPQGGLDDPFTDYAGVGKLQPRQIRDLLNQIKVDLDHTANQRSSLLAKKRASADQRRRRDYVVDVAAWRKQLTELIDRGLTNINIGYWRVSTAKQTEHEGPDSQIKDVVTYSNAGSPRGVDLWCFDVDSGKEETRVALDFLQDAMKTGCVKSVTAQRLDRFARNNYLAECLQREAFANRVQLLSATEHIPEGAIGIMFRQMLQALAQYEAALITARMTAGKRVKKEIEGTWGGGEVPFGYWAVGGGRLIICEPEARVIQLIFYLYSLGYNQTAISEALNRWGIPTRKRGRLGWRQGQVRRTLKNEAKYRAEALFSETVTEFKQVAHPAILPHRPKGQRSYLHGVVRTYLNVAVPDDLELGDFAFPAHAKVQPLEPEQAVTLATMFELRDSGLTISAVTEELNRLGLRSLSGRDWKWSNVRDYLSRKEMYTEAIKTAGVTPVDVQRTLRPGEIESQAIERIFELKKAGLSLPKIHDRLKQEKVKTAGGSDWSISSIHRVLNGKRRQAVLSEKES
jgi:DNA invertase Pin-like site-specific DNA recombinase